MWPFRKQPAINVAAEIDAAVSRAAERIAQEKASSQKYVDMLKNFERVVAEKSRLEELAQLLALRCGLIPSQHSAAFKVDDLLGKLKSPPAEDKKGDK